MPGKRLTITRLALSPSGAAEALNLSYTNIVLPAIEAGELAVYDVRGRKRIATSDLETWLKSHPTVLSLARKARTHAHR
ncbi:hypothetical protein [Bradyrhizobium genosp. P]|uniref:hypothetical protein n=1 Tax=Bradyrhizobium genosp. P TaxID=83641 RepID=UPI003CF01A3C